jgi:Fe-S cluster assembly protein SufD
MSTATAARPTPASTLPAWIEAAAAAAVGPAWLAERRRDGLEAFAAAGFPGRREEDWKYTDLKLVARRSFALDAAPDVAAPEIEGLDCPAIVFLNDRLVETRGLPEGAAVLPLAQAIAAAHPACRELLGRIVKPERHRFAALATALFTDGILLDLPPGMAMAAPLRLVFLAGGEARPGLACPRVLVRAGANSRATIIEHYGAAPGESLSLAVTELALAPGAHIEHYRLQEASGEAFHLGRWARGWSATPPWSAITFPSAGASRVSTWTWSWRRLVRGST